MAQPAGQQAGPGQRRNLAGKTAADKAEQKAKREQARARTLIVLRPFGDRVRGLRERSGMSQGELAQRSGIHRVTINRVEAGQQDIGASHLPRLAEALGVEVGDLYGEEPRPSN